MSDQVIFYGVFAVQIMLLSAYYPSRVLQRVRYIIKNYPPSTHAKLYPKKATSIDRYSKIYTAINAFILVLGWVLMYGIYTGVLVGEKGINPMLPWAYFMVQMVPSLLLEFFGFKLGRLMKQQDQRTTKSATLKPRRFFDLVSPTLFTTVVVAYLGFVAFAFYLEGFQFELGSKAFLMSLILLVANVVFFAVMSWVVYGKKCDPYQSTNDRQKTAKFTTQTMCFVLLAVTGFMALAMVIDTHNMKSVMPVVMSLFLQFLVVASTGYMLNKQRIEDIDFSVYKTQEQPQSLEQRL